MEKVTSHVALFTSVGMGHLIPFCELARHLSSNFNCKITFIVFHSFSESPHSFSYLANLESSNLPIDLLYIPVNDNTNKEVCLEERIDTIMKNAMPTLYKILESLPVSVLIIDFFCCHLTGEISKQLGLPIFIFFTSAAAFLSVMLHGPRLLAQISVPIGEVEFGIQLPGLFPISGKDMPNPLLGDRSGYPVKLFITHSENVVKASGILINTFGELERSTIKSLKQRLKLTQKLGIYCVGPVISRLHSMDEDQCVKWLNTKREGSVVFVSFGSGVTLSDEQIVEIAYGLEMSGQAFLWVVRRQVRSSDVIGSYLSIPETRLEDVLPEGFIERCSKRGLVVPSWAPQIAVLSHPSTGGFVTHCGWNSILEGVSCGVPMIAWPMFAEQRMNRIIVVKELGVGLELEIGVDGLVKREDVETSVKELMDGEHGRKVRGNVKGLQKKARDAMEAHHGSSWKDMAQAVAQWTAMEFESFLGSV